MSSAVEQRYNHVVKTATEIIDEAAPRVLSVSHVARRVSDKLDLSKATALKYIRKAVTEGKLHELKPDYRFHVRVPGASEKRIVHTRLVVSNNAALGPSPRDRQVLAEDQGDKMRTISSYGPGNTTYLITPGHAQGYIAQEVARRRAERESALLQRKARLKTEREEIDRRKPGLRLDIKRLDLVLGAADGSDEDYARVKLRLLDLEVHEREDGKESIPEASLYLDVDAKDSKIDLLQDILNRGLQSWLADQPMVECRHGDGPILLHQRGGNVFWWHVGTARVHCANGETEAEPVAVRAEG